MNFFSGMPHYVKRNSKRRYHTLGKKYSVEMSVCIFKAAAGYEKQYNVYQLSKYSPCYKHWDCYQSPGPGCTSTTFPRSFISCTMNINYKNKAQI